MGKEQIIDSSDLGIVFHEKDISISDEKLKNILEKVYERADTDLSAFHFYNLWKICLSIAGTLFLTILTSTFNSIGPLDSNTVNTIAWLICAFLFVVGFILLIIRSNKSIKDFTIKRDIAVQRIMSFHINREKWLEKNEK